MKNRKNPTFLDSTITILLIAAYLEESFAQYTFFVAITGDPANDCLSVTSPCPTMSKAVALIASLPTFSDITLNIEGGVYVGDCTNEGLSITANSINIIGHSNVPSFDCLNEGRFLSLYTASVNIENVAIKNSTSDNGGAAISWYVIPKK